MHSKRFFVRLLGLVAALALVAAACGDDSDSSSGDDSGGGGDLDGVSLTVGSKDFTENILLGEMLVQALEAEGADASNQIDLGGTSVNREALLAGDIDVYPEYNGTGWTVHLGNEDPSSDGQELYDVTAEADLEQNQIQWSGRSPFNDTYGFAANADVAEENGGGFDLDSMAEYLEANPDATLCLETEFPDRPDGLVLFEEATGYEVPTDQIQILDGGLIYTETQSGACDIGEIFTTDGRIEGLGLSLVEDPGVFIIYNISYTYRDDVYQENAETLDSISETILAGLDDVTMAELNGQVDLDGEPAEDVAQQYLEEIGVL